MKFVNPSWKIFAVVAGSFALGAWLSPKVIVFANPQAPAQAHVFIVPVPMRDARSAVPTDISGARIAGISCIAKPSADYPDAAVCYVAAASKETK